MVTHHGWFQPTNHLMGLRVTEKKKELLNITDPNVLHQYGCRKTCVGIYTSKYKYVYMNKWAVNKS